VGTGDTSDPGQALTIRPRTVSVSEGTSSASSHLLVHRTARCCVGDAVVASA
jgi:hypothetical protein